MVTAAVLYVVGCIVLPETISMQINAKGTLDNAMNKYVGLLIPFAITAIFAYLFGFGKNENKRLLYLFIAPLGFIAFALTFGMNLR